MADVLKDVGTIGVVGEEWMMAELSRSRDGRQARADGGAQEASQVEKSREKESRVRWKMKFG